MLSEEKVDEIGASKFALKISDTISSTGTRYVTTA
jgi:hypothetical protein